MTWREERQSVFRLPVELCLRPILDHPPKRQNAMRLRAPRSDKQTYQSGARVASSRDRLALRLSKPVALLSG